MSNGNPHEKVVRDEECHKSWLGLRLDRIERLGGKSHSAKLVSFDDESDA